RGSGVRGEAVESESDRELKELKESLADTQPVGALVATCRTLDQAKAVVTFLDAVSEKTLRSTVAITAARGRGKSASLGVAVAGAVALGYSNIFVTAPSPENLKTLFEFVFKGFDAIGYKEHIDYELVESTNPAFNRAIVRVNVFHQHRQTIQSVPAHVEWKLLRILKSSTRGVESTNPAFNRAIVRVNVFHQHRQTIQVRACPCGQRRSSNGFKAVESVPAHVESTNPAFNRAILRVNVFHQHTQTIQVLEGHAAPIQYVMPQHAERVQKAELLYVMPQHAERVQQAELLVIDEAAAIPLPMVKALLGPYLVFMGSTVNGYEGTGWSLSLKRIQQLREQSKRATAVAIPSSLPHLPPPPPTTYSYEGTGRSLSLKLIQQLREQSKGGQFGMRRGTLQRHSPPLHSPSPLPSPTYSYEGTGRSLSLKLIQQLREQSKGAAAAGAAGAAAGVATTDGGGSGGGGGVSVRVLREVELQEPIRYAEGDPVEKWLNHLLCLDATSHVPKLQARMPHPDECELFYVNRDTLFSFHSASELFLQRMMALYVSSHYKNTPNDLQLMSDAPAHHLFVLLGPVDESQTSLPDVLCVLQVCLEGEISRASALKGLSQGHQPTGDLLPWTLSQQFQDSEFPSLSGARVVRIAVHPDLMHAGYGSRAVDLLSRYYEGQLTSMGEENEEESEGERATRYYEGQLTSMGEDSEEESEEEEEGGKRHSKAVQEARENGSGSLLEEQLAPRSGLPPLLQPVGERRQEQLHYVGVSFGLGQQLFNFWRRQAFVPLYVRQTPSDITGEHTCIMLKPLRNEDLGAADAKDSWLASFSQDFHRRFLSLLGFSFRPLPPALCLSILDPQIEFAEAEAREAVVPAGLMEGKAALLSPYDMKRLESYANNLVDYHLIMDLIPPLARLYFLGLIPASLSYAQAAILLSFGLQHHELSTIEANLRLPGTQVLALFNKAIRKIHSVLYAAAARTIEAALPRIKEVDLRPHPQSVDEDLAEAADQAKKVIKSRLEGAAEPGTATLLTSLTPGQMQEFAIDGRDQDFEAAIAAGGGKLPGSGVLSIKAQGGGKKRGGGGDGNLDGGGEGGKKRMKAMRSADCSPLGALLTAGRIAHRWAHCSPLGALLTAGRIAHRWAHCSPLGALLTAGRIAHRWAHCSPLGALRHLYW
ncbi:unnamed protein product, partial [Closterium sp. NIES-65]